MRYPITSIATKPLFSAIRAGRLDHVRLAIRAGAELNALDEDGALPLNLAIELVDVDVIEELLDSGADPNSEADPYWTPLGLAASRGNDRFVSLLLHRGAYVNMVAFTDRRTPLIHAIRHKHISTIKLLLDANAQVHIRDRNGRTALTHAVLAGLEEVVRDIRDRGALVNINDIELKTARQYAEEAGRKDLLDALGLDLTRYSRLGNLGAKFVSAAHDGNIPAMEAFREMGADIEESQLGGLTAIHSAAFSGQVSSVIWLLEHGASIDTKNDEDEPFIFSAVHGGNAEILQLAIQHGLHVNERNDYGSSPLHAVLEYGSEETARWLLAAGADINARDNSGVTPLMQSILLQRTDMTELLRANGARIRLAEALVLKDPVAVMRAEVGDSYTAQIGYVGGSLLHYAAQTGFLEGIERLLNLGSPLEGRDQYGLTPLHRAASAGQASAVIRLIAAGAEIDSEARDHTTPLIAAVNSRCYASVEALLAAGADPYIKNRSGISAFDCARRISGRYGFPQIDYDISDFPAMEEAKRIADLLEYIEWMSSGNVNLNEDSESYIEE